MQKKMYLVAFLLFLSGVSYLMYSGLSENSMYFLNVSEALASPSEKLQNARLFGTVATEGLDMAENGKYVKFQLIDKDQTNLTMWIEYQGTIPDTFKEGAEVIVEGGLGTEHIFQAKTLMTKCPSKYQKENRT